MTYVVSVGLCFPFLCLRIFMLHLSSKICSSYFISKDKVLKVAVRNVLHDNAIMAFFENHRIQLDNVVMVQYVRLRFICQLSLSSAKINA